MHDIFTKWEGASIGTHISKVSSSKNHETHIGNNGVLEEKFSLLFFLPLLHDFMGK
jgi:hypothetical protein